MISALSDMEKLLGEIPFCSEDDRDEASYLYRNAALAIRAWKCHLLRTVRQYQARFDAFDLLDEQTVLLVNDWAIKFIPQKHRESQADWFGKRGISWHTSAAYRKVDQQLQSCSQGSAAVVAILQHIIQTLKLEHPEIERVFLRQDNSGCYHSASTNVECTRIEASTGVKIEGLDFSDPQGGKGAADRLAAAEKSQIRMFINEGNDVTDAQQIKDAFLSHGGIEGVRVAVSDSLEESTSGELPKIAGISKLNNFRLTGGKLTAWRAYAVGKGKLLELTTIPGL